MDGSETGWGRPAEPAPRWRALLDRARLGGRGTDQSVERQADEDQPPPSSEPLPRRGPGSGYSGRVAPVGQASVGPPPPDRQPYGVEPGYRAEASFRVEPPRPAPTYPGQPGYPADSGYPADPGYSPVPEQRRPDQPRPEQRRPEPGESRYTLLDNGYRHAAPPMESRYALLDNGGYQPPAPPAQAPPAAPPGAVGGRPGRFEWRAQGSGGDLERAAAVLRRDLGTPRVIAFANPKGGVHKTTATVLAAATVGSVRGRGVLAWDDNELRGTLGLRAGSARHARTIRHLVADLVQIEIREGPELLEILDDYLRHASDGSYDVLAGEESPRFAQRLDQFTVKRVLELLRRTHDVICVDTGNNVESPNWRTVMQAADQLVVTTVPREDAAFSADWMLDLLHEEGMGELADNAVTLISCPTPGRLPLQGDLERHFATRTRAVTVVPYDPALETGSSIEYHQLQGETRQAWLRAASAMLDLFGR
ncbi:MinD/ParA family ATP-binding protein [Micromonospora craniellae]|uniref:ATPase n=1 Tax=Micromonospora craniellae TaxID=2294034 RepID=A0A372G2J0_9ACTN|nr:AAA family ATPase [Micromonospora craniellae]QOC91096.1 AAA family ATPase [Micromonospora craniellae]RFS47222.1 ATPase [Micromonospora craniellae]